MPRKMLFERSPDTDRLVIVLRGTNGEASYLALAAQTELEVSRVKTILPSARRALMREKILFGTVRGLGVRRLAEPEKVGKIDQSIKQISRVAKRGEKEVSTVHYEQLANADQHRLAIQRLFLAGVRSQARATQKPRAAEPKPQSPDTQTLIEKFKKKKNGDDSSTPSA